MSYMCFQQECLDCHETWNAAFGIVGNTQIASPPLVCPHCGSNKLTKIADYWKTTNGGTFPQQQQTVETVPVKKSLRNRIGDWLVKNLTKGGEG